MLGKRRVARKVPIKDVARERGILNWKFAAPLPRQAVRGAQAKGGQPRHGLGLGGRRLGLLLEAACRGAGIRYQM